MSGSSAKYFLLPHDFHVLIIDDGSPGWHAIIVKQLQQEFPERLFMEERSGKQGLGTAYIHGFQMGAWPISTIIVFEMDADFSHNPDDLLKLRHACIDGADAAIGSRYIKGVNVVNWPMSRVLMSYFASVYVRFITGIDIQDWTAGFMCYKRKVLETVQLDKIKFVGYAFQIEMKYTTIKHGFKIIEVPDHFYRPHRRHLENVHQYLPRSVLWRYPDEDQQYFQEVSRGVVIGWLLT